MATIRELMELEEKLKKAGIDAKSSAPVIREADEKKRLTEEIEDVLAATAPKIPEPESRELGATVPGERMPMDHPTQGTTERERRWFEACHTLETDLGIVIDPNPQNTCAWIALRMGTNQSLLLLHKLPLLNRADVECPF